MRTFLANDPNTYIIWSIKPPDMHKREHSTEMHDRIIAKISKR